MGAIAYFQCHSGFTLVGDHVRQCVNHAWTGSQPSCQKGILTSLFVYLSVCVSVYVSVCLSVCLSVYLSVYLSVCLSVCLSVKSECNQ